MPRLAVPYEWSVNDADQVTTIERSILSVLKDNPYGIAQHQIDGYVFPCKSNYSIKDYIAVKTAIKRLIHREEVIIYEKEEETSEGLGEYRTEIIPYLRLTKPINQVMIVEE